MKWLRTVAGVLEVSEEITLSGVIIFNKLIALIGNLL